jgi:hypothetical protein
MSQLALFEGFHIPRNAAREALGRGELGEASAQLARLGGATTEAIDAARLERIGSALRETSEDPIRRIHAAFVSVLGAGEPDGFLSDAEWFRLYAQRLARALDAEPARGVRGWLAAHYAWAAGETDAALRASTRIVESMPSGQAWIEAARFAFHVADAARAQAWIHAACVDSPVELSARPPDLESCGVPALDAAPSLPPLPAPIEDLFEAARRLDALPTPRVRWVAVLGEIDRILVPAALHGGDPGETVASDTDPVRAFLVALRAARRSRERDGVRGTTRCSDRELRARRRMQRIAPDLLTRYLHGLGGSLL